MLGKNERKTLQEYANKIVNELKDQAPIGNGDLINSIKGEVSEEGDITITALGYIQFQDKGVNGTEQSRGSVFSFKTRRPPISALKGFSDRVGINVYALQNSIFKKGFRGKFFIDRAYRRIITNLPLDVTEAINDDFVDNLLINNKNFKKV
jgi:hypothetical protein